MFTKPLLALSITAAISSTVFAEEEFRQHEAHVHGHVELNIAQDAQDLLIEINAPGADVVGFEHAPQSDEESAVLKKAVEILNHADSVFELSSSAECHLELAEVKHSLGDEHDEHDHDEDHDEAHDHDHDTADHHDEHEEHGEHQDHEDHQHGSFTVQYTYHCDNIAELNSIETQWFNLFPSTKEIDVNLLTDKTQSASELKPNKTRISL